MGHYYLHVSDRTASRGGDLEPASRLHTLEPGDRGSGERLRGHSDRRSATLPALK
jgi:hypothetical protein